MESRLVKLLYAPLALLLSGVLGCHTTLYEWGDYEDSVYNMCCTPDEFELGDEIRELTEQLERTANKERLVPPGLHAHLGYLYYLAGEADSAAGHFRREKELFPESSVFVDGLLRRMVQG